MKWNGTEQVKQWSKHKKSLQRSWYVLSFTNSFINMHKQCLFLIKNNNNNADAKI